MSWSAGFGQALFTVTATHIGTPVGSFEATVGGVERDVVQVGHVVVGAEVLVLSPAAAPHQLQRGTRLKILNARLRVLLHL